MNNLSKQNLGSCGLSVSRVGLGCMGMSEFYGKTNDQQNLRVLDKAFDLGCTFWDTADMYGPFENEKLLGISLKQRREQVTLATKFGIHRNNQGAHLGIRGSAQYVKSACEASLNRLGTDYIDLYYQHRVDPLVPIEETVEAMADLVKEGKVRYLGLSEASAETIERANKVHPISAVQTELSLWSRDVEDEVLPTLNRLGIGLVAYSPLGRGFLTGTITNRQGLETEDWRLLNPRFTKEAINHNWGLVEYISLLATQKGCTTAQLALAWLHHQFPNIAMIPGTTNIQRLEENIRSVDIPLSNEELHGLTQFSNKFHVLGSRY